MDIYWFFIVLDIKVRHKKSEIDYFYPAICLNKNLTTINLVLLNTIF